MPSLPSVPAVSHSCHYHTLQLVTITSACLYLLLQYSPIIETRVPRAVAMTVVLAVPQKITSEVAGAKT
ncbi:hypothetical protein E2C01_075488 [Portunus trituberculatus]|uniref:Uncharacterized protein n=1 Tax=Portunus trituberculatus TaxID=210409 RepID=A0A5B7I680_PORTR|nr:hypothetical protein [Portunus trituberculatus]